jgi:SAM-dependent methyltransferase
MTDPDGSQARLPEQYQRRFGAEDESRHRVWKVLVDSYFQRYLDGVTSVLDMGCGWGHFINQVDVPDRHGIDLNPDVADRLDAGVHLHTQPANERWPLEDGALDLVFTSNFLEHLPDREAVMAAVAEAHRCLRPGGRLVAMGPNIRVVGGKYWDFFDHLVPLTDQSIVEVMELAGFEVETAYARFLPFTMVGKPPAPPLFVKVYLKLRPAWRLLGGQFLVVAHRRVT